MDYEAHVLGLVTSIYPPTGSVRAVELRSYDSPAKLLCISDGGSKNLKTAYTIPALDISRIGADIALWLANLHITTANASLALPHLPPSASRGNNPVAVAVYRYSYDQLHTAFAGTCHDQDLAHAINERFGSLLATDEECICHGDLWPGNILLTTDHIDTQITVVDWEMCRIGTSATDVAQFAAESFLLDTFRNPSRGLLKSFLTTYMEARLCDRNLNKTWVTRFLVHFAVHLTFWPTRVVWMTGASTISDTGEKWGNKKLINCGATVLQGLLDGDWETVLSNDMVKGLRNALEPLLVQD